MEMSKDFILEQLQDISYRLATIEEKFDNHLEHISLSKLRTKDRFYLGIAGVTTMITIITYITTSNM